MCILAAPSPHPPSWRILQDEAPRTCKTVALGQAPKYSLARHSHLAAIGGFGLGLGMMSRWRAIRELCTIPRGSGHSRDSREWRRFHRALHSPRGYRIQMGKLCRGELRRSTLHLTEGRRDRRRDGYTPRRGITPRLALAPAECACVPGNRRARVRLTSTDGSTGCAGLADLAKRRDTRFLAECKAVHPA